MTDCCSCCGRPVYNVGKLTVELCADDDGVPGNTIFRGEYTGLCMAKGIKYGEDGDSWSVSMGNLTEGRCPSCGAKEPEHCHGCPYLWRSVADKLAEALAWWKPDWDVVEECECPDCEAHTKAKQALAEYEKLKES